MTAPPTGLRAGFLAATSRIEIGLGPLTPREAAAYIRHRVRVADGPADLFDEPAARELGSASRGAPQALDRLAAACLAAAVARGTHRIDVDLVRATVGAGRPRSQAATVDERSDVADAAEGGAAAMRTLFERLWMQAETDEFQFSASSAASAGASAAVATPEAAPAALAVGDRHAPPDGPRPARVPGAARGHRPAGRSDRGGGDAAPGGVRIPHRARAPRRPADARASSLIASGGASREKAAVSVAATLIAALAVGAGIGWHTAPWSFAAGAGGVADDGAVPIGLKASVDEAEPSSWAVAAVPAAAARGPSGDAVSLHRLPEAGPPPEWEADARALYQSGVGAEDPEAAVTAYARAALRGHERAARYLGQIYELGEGVEATPRLARAWYGFAEAGAEAAPSVARQAASPSGASSGAPVPMFSARTPDGAVELVWSGRGGEAGYTVEFARDPLGEPVASLVTPISAALVTVPEDVGFWRVLAGGGAAEGGWAAIGPPAAP